MIVYADIVSLTFGIESGFRYDGPVGKTHKEEIFLALRSVRKRVNHARTINALIGIIVADDAQDVFDARVGYEAGAEPVVDETVGDL